MVRNRLRRQLRVVLREEFDRADHVPDGVLVILDPAAADLQFATLRGHVVSAMEEASVGSAPIESGSAGRAAASGGRR